MSVASVRDLRKSYPPIEAVRGVSFEVQSSEILGLIGPNGAGKTTTVECVIGLRQPDNGDIRICDLDARTRGMEVREKIGAALQTSTVQDKITPREALRLYGSFYRKRIDPHALLDRFALTAKADAPFDSLSGGQKQRLSLALAFVNDPELVLLDEPTAGLDPQARRELHDHIVRMRRDGRSVLLTTHDLEEAQALCDRILIIDRGRIVAEGAPHELMARSSALQTISLVTLPRVDVALFERLPSVESLQVDGDRIRMQTSQVTGTVTALMQLIESEHLELANLQVQKATLEDVFIELTGRAAVAKDQP
jgi:ABC-2 type transport system ATP-binding protein